ncbi:MAG: FAD-dependent oxidoreductase, partial [Paludibacteraceae bacterium]|nr:FAD-dependent oxidoreductase [Paludibacteraceae bacterium]
MKLIIIGGGVAGLSAGIYARKRGWETVIYEKNAVAGGECTSWKRQGYHID